jgi:hypothetical protein
VQQASTEPEPADQIFLVLPTLLVSRVPCPLTHLPSHHLLSIHLEHLPDVTTPDGIKSTRENSSSKRRQVTLMGVVQVCKLAKNGHYHDSRLQVCCSGTWGTASPARLAALCNQSN